MLNAQEFLELRKKNKKTSNPNKYGAKKCTYNNLNFPSQLEANCYAYLKNQQECGIVKYIIRQVPFDLPGNAKHLIDFMAVTEKGNIFIESKGRDLPLGKLKRGQVMELYDIVVHLITNPNQIKELL